MAQSFLQDLLRTSIFPPSSRQLQPNLGSSHFHLLDVHRSFLLPIQSILLVFDTVSCCRLTTFRISIPRLVKPNLTLPFNGLSSHSEEQSLPSFKSSLPPPNTLTSRQHGTTHRISFVEWSPFSSVSPSLSLRQFTSSDSTKPQPPLSS